ncbi:MAG TPA: response regulator [Kofleriaceae bacterium]
MARRILIGEDDPGLAKVVALVLRRAGFDVDTALDAITLRHRLSAAHYDLLLLEVRFGATDGLELTRELRARGDDLVIVGWSADGPNDESAALESGCTAFYWKPLSNRVLVELFRELLP